MEPLVRVYMDAPTLLKSNWSAFRDIIMGLAFGNNLTGNPAIFAGTLWCTICHGHKHPTAASNPELEWPVAQLHNPPYRNTAQ